MSLDLQEELQRKSVQKRLEEKAHERLGYLAGSRFDWDTVKRDLSDCTLGTLHNSFSNRLILLIDSQHYMFINEGLLFYRELIA